MANFLYDISTPEPNAPTHSAQAGQTDDEFDEMEQGAPKVQPQPTQFPSESITGTSSRRRRRHEDTSGTSDDILAEIRQRNNLDAQRDQKLQDIQTQQTKMMCLV